MHVSGIQTRIFKEGDSLPDFIARHIPSLREGDIIAVTSKVIALSQGRVGKLEDKKHLIATESAKTIDTPWAQLTLLTDGWAINAGADESNAGKKLILLPQDPFGTAQSLLTFLKRHFSLKKLGVLITDTRSTPLRAGTVGRALGYAGFQPLKSYIGKKDLFGRKSRFTRSNHADALAGAAVLIMGEGDERIPLAVIEGAPVAFVSGALPAASKRLAFPPEKDIFSYLFRAILHRPHMRSTRKNAGRKQAPNP